ncbi:MAG: exopolyphosphatase [Crocinitomicaceae bacterium]|nr:exopolyphosphatase [Crocinitomicaceae bacterium]
MKLAAIDIGSNAIRLLIEEVYLDNGEFLIEKVSLTRVPIRLGDDVFLRGKISKEKTTQLVKTMKDFWYLMEVHRVVWFRACATSAMREAKNKKEVLGRQKNEANVEVDILSGEEEADLIFSNYLTQNLSIDQNYLYIDVGGGSTELTLIKNGKKIKGKSFELGTVRMLSGTVDNAIWEKAHKWIRSIVPPAYQTIAIGTGGNINSIFNIQGKKPNEKLSRKEIGKQFEYLKSLTIEQRIVRLRMRPDRADVILPAAEIYIRLLDFAEINDLLVTKIGLSDGIILDIFDTWKQSKHARQKVLENG